jgi:hypothetical protein
MNRIKVLTVIIIASLVVAGFRMYFPAGPVAIIKKVVNDVRFKTADKSGWDAAKVSQVLSDRDEIKTGSKSLAIILFTDGSGQLRVRENAVLQIYGQKDNKQLNKNTLLQSGSVSFDVNKQADEEFKFTTPTAVASIRGTGGLLGANQDSTTLVLEHGQVLFNSLLPGGGGGTINGGQTGTINRNGQFSFRQSNQNDLNQLNAGKQVNTKKVKIKVGNKILEIEYLSQ